MNYYRYTITNKPEISEILIAFLGELPFDTFTETDDGVEAFIPESLDAEAIQEAVTELSQRFNVSFERTFIKAQNWNKVWEANFQPIIVGDFCGIRADFHESIPKVAHEIIINPKMAFGTGHHATTFMVIEQMKSLDFQGKKVFDYGCGTGILAILAAQLGASSIEAVDIEQASFENTIENAQINGVSTIHSIQGTLNDVQTTGFDIILANINRNVILDSLPTLYSRLVKNGKLIVSGFIEKDRELLIQAATDQGFTPMRTKNKDNWIAILFEKA